jgi:hypothetical protein
MDDIDEEFDPAKKAVETVQHGDGVIPVVAFSDTPRDYAGRDSVFNPLNRLIENTADRDILLDSWHLLQTEKLEQLCFISTDRGDVLSNSNAIERILTDVQVQHPTDMH